jgi:glycosyltransferase involved in cell wall biosynthesis
MSELHIVHNITDHGHFGGTEVVVDALLARGGDQLVLVPDRGRPGRFLALDAAKRPVAVHHGRAIAPDQLFDPDLAAFLRDLLRDRAVERVLFHHLLGFPLNLLTVPALCGVPAAVVWHDFHLACPSFNLLNEAGVYCGIDRLPSAECTPCAQRRLGWPETAMPARRRYVRECLARIDLHVFSTPESLRLARRFYAIEPARVLLCPVPAALPPGLAEAARARPRDLSKVLVPGNLSPNKGSRLLVALADPAAEAGFRLTVAGRIDDAAAASTVETTGAYDRAALAEVAGDCGLALFLSVWPETFSMTLSEMRTLGLTPVAPALGAFRDRIAPGRDGWLFERATPEAVIAALEAARAAGPLPSDEVALGAEDYARRIASALPARDPAALALRDADWRPDVPLDLDSFSLTRPLYYLPGAAPPPLQPAGAPPRAAATPAAPPGPPGLARKALGYYRTHGLRATLDRSRLYLRERRLRNA